MKNKNNDLNLFSNETQNERGIKNPKNPLNDLTGKEWIFNTNSIDVFESLPSERDFNKFLVEIIETKYSTNGKESYAHKIRKIHPSPKPPQLMERLIRFFSKENEIIFDPFMGVGGSLIGATMCNRKAIGIDLDRKYIDTYKEACKHLNIRQEIALVENSKNIAKINKLKEVEFDLIITDPPYGNMMARKKTGEAAKRKKDTAATPFTDSKEDIGNLDLNEFLEELKSIIEISVAKLKEKRYLIIFTKDFQPKPEYHGMLHYDIMNSLTQIAGLKYKGMKIWYDKTINLYPYGYPFAYVGNQLHQYVMIFRKESESIRKNKK